MKRMVNNLGGPDKERSDREDPTSGWPAKWGEFLLYVLFGTYRCCCRPPSLPTQIVRKTDWKKLERGWLQEFSRFVYARPLHITLLLDIPSFQCFRINPQPIVLGIFIIELYYSPFSRVSLKLPLLCQTSQSESPSKEAEHYSRISLLGPFQQPGRGSWREG